MADEHRCLIRSNEPLPLRAKEPPPARANGGADNDGFVAFWHGDADVKTSRPWLVFETIPEVGVGLLSGQWGTYKTFVAMDLACAIMSATEIFGSAIDRRGGVLFFAGEGETEVPIRLQASIDNRCPELAKAAPFAWLTPAKLTLNLLDPSSINAFIARAKQVDTLMRARFDLPLVLIEIDTVAATAGFAKSGDENDAVLGARLMKAGLGEIARRTGTFVLGLDHFGKTAETGTRGSSGKEDNADVVFAALGEKSITGIVTNPRLAVRKVRGGAAGREHAYSTTIVSPSCDAQGRSDRTLAIRWAKTADDEATGAKAKDKRWSKSLTLFKRKLTNAIDDAGKEIRPYPDGPVVRAVDSKIVRVEFCKEYPVDDDSTAEQKKETRRQAWGRAIKDAQSGTLIVVREIEGIQYIWLA
jgi:hypothetical protein